MITCHGYSKGYNNPMCDTHKNMGVYYTWQNIGFLSFQFLYPLLPVFLSHYIAMPFASGTVLKRNSDGEHFVLFLTLHISVTSSLDI